MSASAVWSGLTRRQRELLLSSVGGWPVKPSRSVLARMVSFGLVNPDLTPTDAGRNVVRDR